MKKLVAYSSVSHMGFIVLGLFAGTVTSTQGATDPDGQPRVVDRGPVHARRRDLRPAPHPADRGLRRPRGGDAASTPRAFLIATLSSIGLPGLNGFVGEFLILTGSFAKHPVAVVLASTGIVLGAVYMLIAGPARVLEPAHPRREPHPSDLTWRETAGVRPARRVHGLDRRAARDLPVRLSEAAVRHLIGG